MKIVGSSFYFNVTLGLLSVYVCAEDGCSTCDTLSSWFCNTLEKLDVAEIGQYWLLRFSLDIPLHESTHTNPKCQVCCNFTHLVWYCSLNSHLCSDLIFVTNILNYIRVEKICHVEKFHLSIYENCGEIDNSSTCGDISAQLMEFYCNLCRFVAKSATYAVLSRNFCHNLRAFMWKKNDKYQVGLCFNAVHCCLRWYLWIVYGWSLYGL